MFGDKVIGIYSLLPESKIMTHIIMGKMSVRLMIEFIKSRLTNSGSFVLHKSKKFPPVCGSN